MTIYLLDELGNKLEDDNGNFLVATFAVVVSPVLMLRLRLHA